MTAMLSSHPAKVFEKSLGCTCKRDCQSAGRKEQRAYSLQGCCRNMCCSARGVIVRDLCPARAHGGNGAPMVMAARRDHLAEVEHTASGIQAVVATIVQGVVRLFSGLSGNVA